MTDIRYGLVGEKLGHSHSARIHAMLGNGDYRLLGIPQDEIEAFLSARAFRGLNVTIPYKRRAFAHCDLHTEAARRTGSVNTLVVEKSGRMLGDNTDYAGFLYLAGQTGISFLGKKVLVLGSGGAAATVVCAAQDAGAREVLTVSRTGSVNYQNVYAQADADLLVNATPVGMLPNNGEKPVEAARFPALSGVLDLIYNPLRTALILDAQRLGIPCAGGLSMLVAQAKYAAERFFDEPIGEERIASIERSLRRSLTNLVLIGMPGSGKTSVGLLSAQMLGREFVDTDALVCERAGMTIPELFARQGEDGFRALEAQAVAEAGRRSGLVIATGGGAVLRRENADALRQNGFVVLLRRPLWALGTEGRPLSTDIRTLSRMQTERAPAYARCANAVVDNETTIEEAAAAVMEAFDEHSGNQRA